MVTVSVSAPREDSLLITASLVKTILVVEHDPSQAESFTQHFSFKDHHYAKLVTSAAAALHFVKHIKPDLFLLAYHLPDMDGLTLYDLLHETRGLASTSTIIVGVPLPREALAVIRTQQLILLGHPIDLEELGRAIAQLGISFVMTEETRPCMDSPIP
ncbi:MAG TPA: response regulator [Ktedonobacteraceae bacterium]|nr:response regulator [Ktedonobacteraceae bacterium]